MVVARVRLCLGQNIDLLLHLLLEYLTCAWVLRPFLEACFKLTVEHFVSLERPDHLIEICFLNRPRATAPHSLILTTSLGTISALSLTRLLVLLLVVDHLAELLERHQLEVDGLHGFAVHGRYELDLVCLKVVVVGFIVFQILGVVKSRNLLVKSCAARTRLVQHILFIEPLRDFIESL